jgi:hypothetical protein
VRAASALRGWASREILAQFGTGEDASMTGLTGERWLMLIYRVPAEPSRGRVAVWRDLRRLGAYFPQHAVSVLPDRPGVREELARIRERIEQLDGTAFSAELTGLSEADERQLITGFRSASETEYGEIIEACESTFIKGIEFEKFRESYAVEVEDAFHQELDKIKRWQQKVVARDWMGTPLREVAELRISDCEESLEAFEMEAYDYRQNAYQRSLGITSDDDPVLPQVSGRGQRKHSSKT